MQYSPRNEAERQAYLHGRADAEADIFPEIRRVRDSKLSAFFWGVTFGALTYATIVLALSP